MKKLLTIGSVFKPTHDYHYRFILKKAKNYTTLVDTSIYRNGKLMQISGFTIERVIITKTRFEIALGYFKIGEDKKIYKTLSKRYIY